MPKQTAVVFAGGFGTRLRGVVSDVPKPMAQVGGAPFLVHLLRHWRVQGVERFILSTGYLHEKISHYFGARFEGCEIEYVVETHPLGTGGALVKCCVEKSLNSPFLLLNGDTYFDVSLSTLMKVAAEHDADWTFSLFETTDGVRFLPMNFGDDGRVSLTEGGGRQFRMDAQESAKIWANGGVYWVNPRALQNFFDSGPCSLENDILPTCASLGQRMYGVGSSGVFIDIGVPEDFNHAQTMGEFSSTGA